MGHPVCQLKVTDADIPPNSEPFIFDIQSGNEGSMFRLEEDGMLRTAARFNHKSRQHYVLRVRVFDSGMPPLYSDTWVTIKVCITPYFKSVFQFSLFVGQEIPYANP